MLNSEPVRVQETMPALIFILIQKCHFSAVDNLYCNLENQNLKMYVHTLSSVLGEIFKSFNVCLPYRSVKTSTRVCLKQHRLSWLADIHSVSSSVLLIHSVINLINL